MAPIAESYHYCLVLPSIVVAWWWVPRTGLRVPSWGPLLAATLLLAATQRVYGAPAVQEGGLALFAYPRVYGAFMLWGWLVQALDGFATRADT
jgi:hypothetical protein